AVDVDVAAGEVERVVGVAILQLGVVLDVGEHADTDDRVVRFGSRRLRRRGLCVGPRRGTKKKKRTADEDTDRHMPVFCTTTRFPRDVRMVKSVLTPDVQSINRQVRLKR